MSFRITFDWDDKVYVFERWDAFGLGWVTFMKLPLDSAESLRKALNVAIEGKP
jgi:hypothetical protein